MSRLAENYEFRSNSLAAGMAECLEIDKATRYIQSRGVALASYDNYDAQNGKVNYLGSQMVDIGQFILNDLDDIIDEVIKDKAPLMSVSGHTDMLCTNRAVAEIANLRGLHGSALTKPSKARDTYIQELGANLPITLVAREEAGVSKVLSVRSDRFRSIPLGIIENVLNGLLESDWIGAYKCAGWNITQDCATLCIEFPDLADALRSKYPQLPNLWIPGIAIKNGTTGYCPLSVEMSYRKEDAAYPITTDRVYAKHFEKFDVANFIKLAQNEIWGKYTWMPDKLAAATAITIAPEDFETLIEKLFKFIKLNKVFQKKDTETCRHLERIREHILNSLKIENQSGRDVSLYFLMTKVMDVPNVVTSIPAAYRELLANACGRAWQFEI